MSVRRSVFLEALGEDAAKLRPEVFEYVAGPPPVPDVLNPRGVGEGIFEIAGSRFGILMALLRPLVGPELLATRHERDVPFTIVNTTTVGADGRMQLEAVRTFVFRSGPQRSRDVMVSASEPGTLLNYLGNGKRLSMVLKCAVSPEGNLLTVSQSTHVRIGRLRFTLPRLLGITARIEDGFDAEHQRRTVDVDIRNPVVGTVMHYRGWFQYCYQDDSSAPRA